MTSLERNIPLMFYIRVVRWFLLVISTMVVFFQHEGLSMQQILLLQSAFSIFVVLLEIPSGYFSDVMGRKRTMIAGCVLSFVGFSIYCFAKGFLGFFIAEMALGCAVSFISGTDSAIIYDSLLALGRQAEYSKFEGRLMSIGNTSEGIASIIGGLLAAVSLRLPFYVETGLVFFTIPLSLLLTEPPRTLIDTSKGNFRAIWKIVVYTLHGHSELKWLIVYSSFVNASTLTMVWFIQPYMKLVGLPIAWFGVAWAALQFSVGFFSFSAHSIEKRIGRKKILSFLILLSVSGYILVAVFESVWAIGFLLIFYVVRGVGQPTFYGYINSLITSDRRATVLSVGNLAVRLIFSCVGPVIGWIADSYSLSAGFLVAAIIFLVPGLASFFLLQKNSTLIQNQ
jgi:MFS family permease